MAAKTLECLDCGWSYEWDPDDLSSDAAACPLCKELGQILEREATADRANRWHRYQVSQRRITRVVYVLMALGAVYFFLIYPWIDQ